MVFHILFTAILPLTLLAQVEVRLAVEEPRQMRSMFGRRAANDLSLWTGSAVNVGEQPIILSEAALVDAMLRDSLAARHSVAVGRYLGERSRRSAWSVGAQILQSAALSGLLLTATDAVAVNASWKAALASIPVLGPKFAELIVGQGPAVMANWEALSLRDVTILEPSEAVAVTVWTDRYAGPASRDLAIPQVRLPVAAKPARREAN